MLSLASCRKSDLPADDTTTTFLPLAVGNQWTYQVIFSDSTSWPIPIYSVDTVIIECGAPTTLDGMMYYPIMNQHSTISAPFEQEEHLRWADSACYSHRDLSHLTESIYLKREIKVDDFWSWFTYYNSYSYEVTVSDTSMVVLGNSYSEVALVEKIHHGGLNPNPGENTYTSNYYQHGVGLVKQVTIENYGFTVRTVKLISHIVQ